MDYDLKTAGMDYDPKTVKSVRDYRRNKIACFV